MSVLRLYLLIIIFVAVAYNAKTQSIELSDQALDSCSLEVNPEVRSYWNENLPASVVVSFRLNEKSELVEETVKVAHSFNANDDSLALEFVKSLSPEDYELNINSSTDYRVGDCVYYTVSFNKNSPGDPYERISFISFLLNYSDKDKAETHKKVGLELLKQEKYKEASEEFRLVLRFGGYKNAEVHHLLYQCYKALNKQESACIYLEEAKRLNSKYRKVWKQNCK